MQKNIYLYLYLTQLDSFSYFFPNMKVTQRYSRDRVNSNLMAVIPQLLDILVVAVLV